jgi:hypothetical protein
MEPEARVAVVLEKLAGGSLPSTPCPTLWGGPGTGASCIACSSPITPPSVEFECHAEDGRVYILCRDCFVIWDSEVKGRR